MPKPELIARQSSHPRGLIGHVVARVMALDTASVNRRMLEHLEPKPGERILELGCGHGRTLRRVACGVGAGGLAVGVDPSEVMQRIARRHNRSAVAAGRVRVMAGTSDRVDLPSASFDKVFSVHTLYFWPDLALGLLELRRLLREGGELWLGFHSSENERVAADLPKSVYTLRSPEQVLAAIRAAGFADASTTVDDATQVVFAHAYAR
jgi:ubiquinone/menaquinone biosynthesis C-methylase UbiE